MASLLWVLYGEAIGSSFCNAVQELTKEHMLLVEYVGVHMLLLPSVFRGENNG